MIYYAVSRPSFVFGCACILLSIFTDHFSWARAFLSSNNIRMISKSLVIGCVIELVVIELLYCSNATPQGVKISFPTCLIYALGFIIITIVVGILLMIIIEFPLTRII